MLPLHTAYWNAYGFLIGKEFILCFGIKHSDTLHSKPQDKLKSLKFICVVSTTCKKKKTLTHNVLGYVQFSNNYHFILRSYGKHM